MVDRVRQRFGMFIASPLSEAPPYMKLVSPGDIGSGTFIWDLSQPITVPRVFVLELDPFSAVRELVAQQGIESVIHETVVPPLQTGMVTVGVTANLPEAPVGVLQLGVDLFAPPHPPARVQPLTASLLLDKPEQLQSIHWRFSPIEDIAYQYTTFAIVKGTSGSKRLRGVSTSHTGLDLLLGPTDFPLRFLTIQASAALLAQARIRGICRSPDLQGEGIVDNLFTLSTEQPKVALSLPPEIVESSHIEIEAQSLATGQVVSLGTFAAKGLRLDLFSFREYGPHAIEIEGVFDQTIPLIAVDLLPESKLDHPEEAETIALTPAKTTARWNYFAFSPFQAGYVYRTRGLRAEPRQWSAVQSPFTRLQLQTSEFA
jgi:hypothetical protein